MGWNECKSQNGSLEDKSPKVSDKAIGLEKDHILWASVFGTLLLHLQIKKVLSAVCPQGRVVPYRQMALYAYAALKPESWDTTNVSQNNILQTATEIDGQAVENKINTTKIK